MTLMKHFGHLKIELEAILSATNNFADDNCIGKGGFGKVYKGELIHSKGQTMVALKRLDRAFGQGDPEFWKEIIMLSLYRHENIVSLLGFCDDSWEKILVYEYASKGSLDLYLNSNDLSWVRRLKICIGAARGLAYLHSSVETQQRVLHRDIKSSNILLDENWDAKISDFGLSKFGPANQQYTFLVSNTVGTIGYCDPLYVETGLLTKESDVYSFGVVLFEVLCGRLCIGNNNDKRQPLTGIVRQCYEQNKIDEIIYGNIRDEIIPNSLKAFTTIAYQCLKRDREARPLMTEIVKALETALRYQAGIKGDNSETGATVSGGSRLLKQGLMNQLSVRWKAFIKGDSSETGAAVGVNGNYNGGGDDFKKDGLLWFRDIGKYGGGEYSMAVVQANQVLEDQSQIESGSFGTFVGVYDGHGGPDVARYVCDNLFKNFQATSAKDYGFVTPETIKDVFLETENGFTALVSELFNSRPSIATAGSCCLVGVIYQQTLFIANLGDSRVVLGKKLGNTGGMAALQLSSEHNVNIEEARHELRNLHPHDPQIVTLTHGVWRVKGIIQLSRSIGDVYMKHAEYNTDQIPPKFRLPEPMVMPVLSATPSIITHAIQPSDSFLIFASDGLWENLSNNDAVEIVHNNPRAGIAKRLMKAALTEAARKRDMLYSDLRKIDKRVRRHFHDDITVIVLFLNYDQISRGSANCPNVSVRSALEH